MMNYGFTTVAAAIPALRVADVGFNARAIAEMMERAEEGGVEILCLPELCLTGYSCQDLFRSRLLLDKAQEALDSLLDRTRNLDVIAIVGMPHEEEGRALNTAMVIQHGKVMGIQRTSKDAEPQIFATASGVRFAVEIGQDAFAPMPMSTLFAESVDIVFCPSAMSEQAGKYVRQRGLVAQQSACKACGYVFVSSGFGESTQDVAYGGSAFVCENGKMIAEAERFSLQPQLIVSQIDVERLRAERRGNTAFTANDSVTNIPRVQMDAIAEREFKLLRKVNPLPFVPCGDAIGDTLDEIINIQAMALARRLIHTHCKTAVIGISGGLDSTLALLVCKEAFLRLGLDSKGIIGVTMPGFGTSERTHGNANLLMTALKITQMEISIAKSVEQHFEDIGHDINVHDTTYENAQARERTQIIMDLANKYGGMVIGTGDLSELALGWCTYNGDHMSMYAVNAGVPKTLIPYIIRRLADRPCYENAKETLLDVIDTPISPELLPADIDGNIAQKTEDLVGPYELHDFFIYHYVRFGFRPAKIFMLARAAFDGIYDNETIKHWLTVFFRRFFNQQFKRSCMPDGPQVLSVSLSPRGAWCMPSDASSTLWLEECESLND